MQIEIKSEEELKTAAEKILENFSDYRVFAFYGEMGAGKTTFIKEICKALGSADNITSPTFAIINEYTSHSDYLIYHFDFYRIKNLREVYDLGYEDYFYSGNYCFIEWPERVEQLLPGNMVRVDITVTGDKSRRIEVSVA